MIFHQLSFNCLLFRYAYILQLMGMSLVGVVDCLIDLTLSAL
jgi:hypothetical protein